MGKEIHKLDNAIHNLFMLLARLNIRSTESKRASIAWNDIDDFYDRMGVR